MSVFVSGRGELDNLINALAEKVRNVWTETRTRGWSASADRTLRRRLTRMRHRLFLDAPRFEEWLTDEHLIRKLATIRRDGLRYHVVLDLKFFYLLSQLRCHISMSLWSAMPGHPEHRPHELPRDTPPVGGIDIETYHKTFGDLTEAAGQLFEDHGFIPADGTIGDGAHGLPVFWVVVPSRPSDQPIDHLTDGTAYGELTNRLARTFLNVGDARDCVVSHSLLNGRLVTLRRPKDGADGARVSRYLMIPAGHSLTRRESGLEQDIAAIITELTDLETEGASRILSAKADLEIWHNHLRVYNVVVERAVFLWDALSTHLPVRRHQKLSQAHRAVELMHQFLLQALGDLGHIASMIRQATADVADVTADVSDAYDASITERHLASETSLRAALAETGVFAHAHRQAREIAAEATRVKMAYDDLLQSIGHAFEERRVREAEVLQRYGILFSTFLGLGIFVDVLDATLTMDAPALVAKIFGDSGLLAPLASNVTWLLGAAFAGFMLRGLWLFREMGKLGSRKFRMLYDGPRSLPDRRFRPRRTTGALPGVWRVMKDTSTDRLERQSKQDRDWAALDDQLADEYAAVWDAVTGMAVSDRSDTASDDIRALSSQVEQWGMHSLLLTERALRMYRYPLPVLTSLFRCCGRIQGSFLEVGYLPRTSVMATKDLDRSLARLGFRGTELRLIDTWLTDQVYPSAAEALLRIRSLGLKPTMSRSERQRVSRLITQTGTETVRHIPAPRVSPDDHESRQARALLDERQDHSPS